MVGSLSVMKQIIERIGQLPYSQWGLEHKRLWIEYLGTGKLPFSIKELHATIRDIVDKPENRPRGERLLELHRKSGFTLKSDKKAYRAEEGLERLIVVSNADNFFNQVPIGGGKESIDIVVEHSGSSIEFLELKPWISGDSPLYALVESLKNLIEYRIIIERNIKQIKKYGEVNISLLAPREYYAEYFLADNIGFPEKSNILKVKNLLLSMAKEFDTQIRLHSFSLRLNEFSQICSQLYDRQGLSGQSIATVDETAINAKLKKSNWTELVTA